MKQKNKTIFAKKIKTKFKLTTKMKKTFCLSLILFSALFFSENLTAQIDNNLTNLLLEKKIITQREADSLNVLSAFNQKANSENKNFSIGLEFRPRTEYRDGYRQLR